MAGPPLAEIDEKRRRRRSLAIAAVLGGLAVLLYAVTLAVLGPGVMQRPL